jgi:hypothetical protein
MPKERIIETGEFWKQIAPLLIEALNDPEGIELTNKIDSVVKDFSGYDWEYGPSKVEEFYFSLSPGSQVKNFEEIDEVISLAPRLRGWEFISGKPRKEELLNFLMLNENNEEISIETQNWECVVYRFPDQTVDLDVKLDGINGNTDTQYYALDIHLTNLLGERNYLRVVKNFNIVSEFSHRDSPQAFPVNQVFFVLQEYFGLDQTN